MQDEIFEMKLKGYCCSQMVMAKGLEMIGKEIDEDLIAAMQGLCSGMWCGKTCGCLSAAICFLYIADPNEAGMRRVQYLTDWFEDAFGSTECIDLLEGREINKIQKCPVIIENTIAILEEILED